MSWRWLTVARAAALVVLGTLMVRIAWISDDSLITLRTALNLSHGWGPGFNAAESVQAYSHPLWFLLWLGLGSATNEWILTIIALGVVCSLAAVAVVLWMTRSVAEVVLVTGALVLSNAFLEYSSSGLENPLAYLLVAVLIALTARIETDRVHAGRAALAGLAAAGLCLTRLDLILVLLPVALFMVWRLRSSWRILLVTSATFLAPLVLWFVWSGTVYGSLLPNTYLAKRNLAISPVESIVQGVRYLWVSFDHDPVTALVLLVGLVIAIVVGSGLQRAWAAGVVTYLVYVVWIGGDFMAGRFLAVPTCIIVGILVMPTPGRARADVTPAREAALAAGALVVLGAVLVVLQVSAKPPTALVDPGVRRWGTEASAGISDERGHYLEIGRGLNQWLMALAEPVSVPPYLAPDDGNAARRLADIRSAANGWPDGPGVRLTTPAAVGQGCGYLGSLGILTGPTTHMIDECALTDRFLAMQPYGASAFQWRVGHYQRPLPDGYVEALRRANPTLVRDPRLAQQLMELWSQIRRP